MIKLDKLDVYFMDDDNLKNYKVDNDLIVEEVSTDKNEINVNSVEKSINNAIKKDISLIVNYTVYKPKSFYNSLKKIIAIDEKKLY